MNCIVVPAAGNPGFDFMQIAKNPKKGTYEVLLTETKLLNDSKSVDMKTVLQKWHLCQRQFGFVDKKGKACPPHDYSPLAKHFQLEPRNIHLACLFNASLDSDFPERNRWTNKLRLGS